MSKKVAALLILLFIFVIYPISVEDSRPVTRFYQAIMDRRPLAELINIVDNDIRDLNSIEFHGLTPLLISVKANNKALVEHILTRTPTPDIHLTDYEGKNALMYAAGSEDIPDSQVSVAIMEDLLLQSPQDPVEHALILAARAGYTQKVELLLKRVLSYRPRDLNLLKKRLEDLEITYKKIIDLLIIAQKSIRQVPVTTARPVIDSRGVTSDVFLERLGEYYYTVIFNRVFDRSVIDKLEEIQDINTRDTLGMTPIMVGAKAKNIPLVEYILSRNPVLDLRDIEGRTSLVYAAGNIMDQGEPYTEQQISIRQIGTESENESGLTNSEILIKNKSIILVNLLLNRIPDFINPDPDARALRAAVDAGFVSVVALLLQRGYYSQEQLAFLVSRISDMLANYKKIEELLAQRLTGISPIAV